MSTRLYTCSVELVFRLLLQIEREISDEHVSAIAYANDLALLLKADSRHGLEDLGKRTNIRKIPILEKWCRINKLKISATKTTAMLVKGKLDRNRLPILKIGDINVKYKSETKYLGLIMDDKMNFIEHTKYLRNKVTNLIMAIKRIAREKWGIKRHIIEVLYDAVALPIITYGAAGWWDKVGHSMIQQSLMATQRALLLVLTKACRRTATVSMQVIAGKPPLDLEIVKRGLTAKIKRKISVTWRQYEYNGEHDEDGYLDLKMESINNEIMIEWQRRWETETRGRDTYKFISDVNFVKERRWFKPARELVYIVTGYGSIKSSLNKRGLIEDENCDACGEEETVKHMLYDCVLYEDIREGNINLYRHNMHDLIDDQETYGRFSNYVKSLFEIRRTYLREMDSE